MKTRIKLLIYFTIIAVLLLQVIIQKYIGFVKYIDEIIALGATIYTAYALFRKRAEKKIVYSLIIMFIIFVVGLISNFMFSVETRIPAIITDMATLFKGYISFFGFYLLFDNMEETEKNTVIKYLARLCTVIIIPGFILLFVNLFVNINMHTDYVYGLRAFHYIFLRVGNLKTFCVRSLIIFTLALINNKKREKEITAYIIMSLVLMVSTLRARAFIIAFLYIIGYIFFIVLKKNKFKLRYTLPTVIPLLIIAAPKIQYYFANTKRARYVLLKYGFETAKKYFPLGAGFATYGTYAASTYKSILYKKYNFNKYHGLSDNFGAFLTDNYWPAIMGEFGIIGVILFCALIINIIRMIFEATKDKLHQRFIALFGIVTMIIESTVSSSFSDSHAVFTMLLIAVAITYKGGVTNENINRTTNAK